MVIRRTNFLCGGRDGDPAHGVLKKLIVAVQ
jgi:hypothetical protein